MKPDQSCEYCKEVGTQRKIDALHIGPKATIAAVLCNECFDTLGLGETEIWVWFRQKYPKKK